MTDDTPANADTELEGASDALRSIATVSDPTSTDWMRYGACCDTNEPRAFFPGPGASDKDAKAICATCPAQRACLAYALTTNQAHGIWGGVSVRERKRMRARLRQAQNGAAA